MSARNPGGQTLAVTGDGTDVPLPSTQILQGFTANPSSTAFTVPETGTYLILYRLQVPSTESLTARMVSGGAALPGSISTQVGNGSYGTSFVANLNAGDALTLQLTGSPETVTLQEDSGASMSVVRLS